MPKPRGWGGDEFVFLVPSCDRRRAEQIAEELLRTITMPVEVGNIRMRPSGSVGVAVLGDAEESLALIERADRAMPEAKRLGGGGRYVVSGDEQVLDGSVSCSPAKNCSSRARSTRGAGIGRLDAALPAHHQFQRQHRVRRGLDAL
ncbi:MAG: diguanylate cyclase [Rhodocyclaceae bacterium]|nr:diguanylate cyclase [Rhodocyclaceae bacterium]